MKKIILAVASVLALGMLVSCKQEISGEIDVNNHNKDLSQIKTFAYKAEGVYTVTQKTTRVIKALGATSTQYDDGYTEVVDTYTPNGPIGLTVSENNAQYNYVTYTYSIPYKQTRKTTYVSNNATTTSAATFTTTQYSHTLTNNNGQTVDFLTGTKTIVIYKVDGKYYLQSAAKDGSQIYVTKDFDPTADVVDLSKFSDTTSVETISYTGKQANAATTTTTTSVSDDLSFDWTGKATKVAGGEVSTLKLTKIK